jgi:glyoxylase-like metal-dependent hydrolase (beta-lactamase superfamily II)
MLERMRAAVPASARIDVLFNTHGNPDHYFGNELANAATIVATEHCAAEIKGTRPEMLAGMMANYRMLGEGAAFAYEVMGNFDYTGITLTPPNRTFSGALMLNVGRKQVQLLEVGPAHTKGDAIAYLPGEKTVFTGDILFIGSHPVMWAGPVGNWIAACERIMALDVDIVVPGHGPITDKNGVRETRDYFRWIETEARQRWQNKIPAEQTARELVKARYAYWGEGERMAANVRALYREFDQKTDPPNVLEEFTAMARLHKELTQGA